jgi:hypothetical protein
MTANTLWLKVVTQVAVVGNAAAADRILASVDSRRALRFDRLKPLSRMHRARRIHRVLRAHGVRYVTSSVGQCRKTSALAANLEFLASFPRGPKGYFRSIAGLPTDAARIRQVVHDLKYIKEKGARDLLATLGIVTEMIAFDVRILGILKGVGAAPPKNIHADRVAYRALQDELIQRVCKPEGITGVVLDRILFQHYDRILSDIAERRA